jgi:hypothetical protein
VAGERSFRYVAGSFRLDPKSLLWSFSVNLQANEVNSVYYRNSILVVGRIRVGLGQNKVKSEHKKRITESNKHNKEVDK